MNIRSPGFRVLALALAGLNGLFVFLIWSRNEESERISPLVAPAAAPTKPSSPPIAAAMIEPLAAWDDILSRPLFFRDRSPWAPTAPAAMPAPSAPDAPLDAKLIGVVETPQKRTALFVTPTAPQGVWLSEGDSIGDWKVLRVTSTAATLGGRGDAVTLRLFPDEP